MAWDAVARTATWRWTTDSLRPKRLSAVLAAVALVVVSLGGSVGASATEGEQPHALALVLPVVPVLTVVGVPASIDYDRGGRPIPAGGRSSPEQLTFTVTSTDAVQVRFAGSDFTGPMVLSADTRLVRLGRARGGLVPNPAANRQWNPSSVTNDWNPVFTSEGALDQATFSLSLRAHVPPAALPGEYAGSIELVFTNPHEADATDDKEGGAADDPEKVKDIPGD